MSPKHRKKGGLTRVSQEQTLEDFESACKQLERCCDGLIAQLEKQGRPANRQSIAQLKAAYTQLKERCDDLAEALSLDR